MEIRTIVQDVKFANRAFNLLLCNVAVCCLLIISCRELPSNPVTPENTKCSLVLKISQEKYDETYIEDSTNKVVSIGIRINFSQYVDSVVIIVKDKDCIPVFTKKEVSIKKNENDTTWIKFFKC